MTRAFSATLLSALLTASMMSCGGESFEGDDDGAAGSTGTGKGGASSAGTGATSAGDGGSGNAGGRPSGGTTGSGGSGSGGGPADLCALPPESGNCNAFFPSFYHNPETGVCEPFVYGGCGGNENRFDSVEACQAACSGGAPDMDTCTGPLECVLVAPHCCGTCDGGLENYTAVNAESLEAFQNAHLCPDIACEPCPMPDPLTANRPYLTATCRDGHCVPIDLREEGATDCQVQEDCYLRDGVGCCEGCGGDSSSLVAVSGGEWINLVCGMDIVGCPACAPIYPPEYAATCEAGRCALILVP